MFPNCWLLKFPTFQVPNVCGLLPLNVVVSGTPSWSAAMRANGLNVEPPWMASNVAVLAASVSRSGPPYIETIAPVCGRIDTTATRSFGSGCAPARVPSVSYTHLRAHETDSYLV